MPDWQRELESLLATLNVSLEGASDGKTPREAAEAAGREPGCVADRVNSHASDEMLHDVVPMEGDEVSAVRSEIEATVGQVVALVRAGRMDRALRDDVIFVLDALTRPRPGGKSLPRRPSQARGPDDSASEWNLASAAAILRFCRIVLRLTNAIAREDEL
jgi:hypothetical protein